MKRYLLFIVISLLLISITATACSQPATKIRVATEADFPPFTYIDEQTGQIVGFDIDLMKAIASKESLEIEFVKVPFPSLLEGMAQGEYDAAISAISITDERKKDMLFSDSYFTAGQVVTARADNSSITGKESLSGRVVGVVTGSTSTASVSQIAGVTIKYYDDYGDVFEDLINGSISAIISDSTVAASYVSANPDKLRIAGEPFTQEYYGIAVAKDKAELLNKINAGLKAVKSEGLIENLTQKWLAE